MIEVSRVVVAQGFEVVAAPGQSQLSYMVESSTGQTVPITAADARTLLDMRLARK